MTTQTKSPLRDILQTITDPPRPVVGQLVTVDEFGLTKGRVVELGGRWAKVVIMDSDYTLNEITYPLWAIRPTSLSWLEMRRVTRIVT
jgi:hypothetical protein